MKEKQLTRHDFVDAQIYFKDGSKKMVVILNNVAESSLRMVHYISNSNLKQFISSNNPRFIETIKATAIDGIDLNLK